jgi:hypothetical protein
LDLDLDSTGLVIGPLPTLMSCACDKSNYFTLVNDEARSDIPQYLPEQARHMKTMPNGLLNSFQPFSQDQALLSQDLVQDAFLNAMSKK